MQFPAIDPVAFSIGSLQLRWYGLMYLLAFFVGSGSTCTSSGNSWCSSVMMGAGVLAACSAAAFAALRSAASRLLYAMISAVDLNRACGAGLLLSTCKQLKRWDFVG